MLASATLPVAHADINPSSVWVTPGFHTYHFDRSRGLNDANPGFGIEYRTDDSLSWIAGRYDNSVRSWSDYAGLAYEPFHWQAFKLGVVVGGINGYPEMRHGGWFAAALPVATLEGRHYGANLAFIPSYKDRLYGGLSFQLKFRM